MLFILFYFISFISLFQCQLFQHPLTNMPPSSSQIHTSSLIPKYENNKLPIGKLVTILCYFSNEGDRNLNITAIMGSLNSPHDFNYHIQNYTYKQIGIILQPQEEATFEYQFQVYFHILDLILDLFHLFLSYFSFILNFNQLNMH